MQSCVREHSDYCGHLGHQGKRPTSKIARVSHSAGTVRAQRTVRPHCVTVRQEGLLVKPVQVRPWVQNCSEAAETKMHVYKGRVMRKLALTPVSEKMGSVPLLRNSPRTCGGDAAQCSQQT